MSSQPVAFLSYAHIDDEHHDGAITTLRERLSKAVHYKTAKPFPIFQDHEGIDWGQHWPKVLDETLSEVRFLITVVSPSFFSSDWCRKELRKFLKLEAEQSRNDLILPIYLEDTLYLNNETERAKDELASTIYKRQYYDWRPFKYKNFTEYTVRVAIDEMANGLVKALRRPIKPDTTEWDRKEVDSVKENSKGNRLFEVPFAEKKDTFATGSFDSRADSNFQADPEDFAKRARFVGLMEPKEAYTAKSKEVLPKPGSIFRDIGESWCPKMAVIPPGSFAMGSAVDEEGHKKSEEPEHKVHIAHSSALGIYSVTFDQFDYFCVETGRRKPDDSGWGRGQRPVVHVNVEDAEAYLAWLSGVTDRAYRLPSEAEWEYACRAGTRTPFWNGATITTDQANYDGNVPYGAGEKGEYRQQTTEVGSFPANPFGLFDMHGNVWEWCADYWHASYDGAPIDGSAWLDGGDPSGRILRGGSWDGDARLLRSAGRLANPPALRIELIGFRCARDMT